MYIYIYICIYHGCSVASRGEWGQRVFGLDLGVLARVMVFACRVEGVRVWRVLAPVTVSVCVFGARVPLASACWVGCLAVCLRGSCVVRRGWGALPAHSRCASGPLLVRSWPMPGALLAHSWCAPGALLVRSWLTPAHRSDSREAETCRAKP